MAAILPTKGNLMAAKRSRALASTGYELMDRKRNILIREMMGLMDAAKAVQEQTAFGPVFVLQPHQTGLPYTVGEINTSDLVAF